VISLLLSCATVFTSFSNAFLLMIEIIRLLYLICFQCSVSLIYYFVNFFVLLFFGLSKYRIHLNFLELTLRFPKMRDLLLPKPNYNHVFAQIPGYLSFYTSLKVYKFAQNNTLASFT